MAIANYGELKTAVSNYVNYGDTSVTDMIPTFIGFANQELNRVLRIPSMEEVIYHDVIDDTLTALPIPNNILELKRMYYNDTFETIDLVDVEMLPRMVYDYSDVSNDGRPVTIARDQDYWRFARVAVVGTRIMIVYWKDVAEMVLDTDSNTFLEQASQALLYRAIGEAYRYLENTQLAEYWFGLAVQQVDLIQGHADKSENGGSVIVQSVNPW